MVINNKLIYTEIEKAKENKATIIITHGIAEYSNVYKETKEALIKAGYNVILYDVRGHGRSQGRRGYIKSYKLFLKDLAVLVDEAKKLSDKVYLIGHSMGAIISLAYVLKYNNVNGLITSGITINTPKELNLFKYIPYQILGWRRIRTNFEDGNTTHLKLNPNDQYNLKSLTVRLIGNILISAMKYIRKNIDKFDIPVLILHGSKDKIVKPSNSKMFYDLVKTDNKKLIEYENSKHNLFNDLETKLVNDDVVKWLDEINK